MQALLEFIPLIVFFLTYYFIDIYAATFALICAFSLTLVVPWLVSKQKPSKQSLITFAVLLVMGTLTIVFRNDLFIKWKVTVVYLLMGTGVLVAKSMFNTNPLKEIFGRTLDDETHLAETHWNKLNTVTGLFLYALAVINIVIAYQFSLDFWVTFKVFGLMGITFVYVFSVAAYIMKHAEDVSESKKVEENTES